MSLANVNFLSVVYFAVLSHDRQTDDQRNKVPLRGDVSVRWTRKH